MSDEPPCSEAYGADSGSATGSEDEEIAFCGGDGAVGIQPKRAIHFHFQPNQDVAVLTAACRISGFTGLMSQPLAPAFFARSIE